MTDRFTAWAMCPKCERVECHGLRAPKPFDPDDPVHRALEKLHMTLRMDGIDRDKPSPSQEASYEVIRQCSCGHEWGQT